jgi:hypothetical protein
MNMDTEQATVGSASDERTGTYAQQAVANRFDAFAEER